jgi:aryl-alcohol dehydrogenase-like predicted oxidoreductase
MTHRHLLAGREVAAIGFGPMRCSYEPMPDRGQAVRTIHAALDAGATLIDTADCYASCAADMHHNEVLIAEALALCGQHRDRLLVATKAGHVRTDRALWERNGRPEHLREACDGSLRALGTECIDLYQLHSPDPEVPFEDQVGALSRLREQGKVAAIGLCNVGRRHIAAARAITPIASVQNRYSTISRESENVLRLCEAEQIPFLAWSPLEGVSHDAPHSIACVSRAHDVSPQRVALAWILAQSHVMIPLVGATRPETARDSVSAIDLVLDAIEIASIGAELRCVPKAPGSAP